MAANPDALAFLGTGDTDAYNLAAVRTKTGGTWLAGAFDLDPRSLQAIKDGALFASVSPEHFLKGALAGWLEAEHGRAGTPLPEGWLYISGLVVTSANIDGIVARQQSDASKLAWFKPQIEKATSDPGMFLRPLDQAR
ncbi:MAG: hypothetical protein AUI14_00540 [Actinobacteria bacterium 13_2_20CM_2_71_6]|nr:MAG: hypothetical protein AUI14_00540 [Actinobacteria bacterium 13_2_20CM_2_71_6]